MIGMTSLQLVEYINTNRLRVTDDGDKKHVELKYKYFLTKW